MTTNLEKLMELTRDKSWLKTLVKYSQPDLKRSLGQLASSLLPFLALWVLMYWSLRVSYWLTLALAVPTAGFMVRIFIIFHDCGHGSFFKTKKANDLAGIITGILTLTPYHRWKHDHAIHHATSSDLDRRGVGDVQMLTVSEYLALPRWRRAVYQLFRHPLLMFTVGAWSVFLFVHRFYHSHTGKEERLSVHVTNAAWLGILLLAHLTIGLRDFFLVQFPILAIGTTCGVWLFYVQHQFEGSYWARHDQWDFSLSGLKGSSFYKLPRLLQWFTGNIGFHHIHHLNPRIPNYNLPKCHAENSIFQHIRPLTILGSLKSLTYRLWDEDNRCMVGFSVLRRLKQDQEPG